MALALCFFLAGLVRSARAAGDPAQGPGGPILVLTAGRSTFGPYYAEILRTEGLNAFTVADIATLTANTLAAHDVVVLARMALTPAQANVLTDWVGAGGNLIAMAPDPALAGLLGITPAGPPLANGYLRVDTSTSPGHGIVNQTMQYHGSAQRYALNGASALATLYSSARSATSHPAVTLRQAGRGQAAAFAYDLAESIVYTRQGNPAWAMQERDGFGPIRSNDKFFGAAAGDTQPDWLDRSKLAIPQADEQQRLFANLILHMAASRKPLPRFWYLPNGKKAVIVMTGDDHGNGGTVGRFEQFRALSRAGCSVADWECVRATSYIYATTPMSDAQAGQFTSEGFEVGLHVNTGCADFDRSSLQAFYDLQVPQFRARFPSAGTLVTQRHHCIAWSDWISGALVQHSHGMRLDTNYYHWPPSWVDNGPGLFTGSAMPMRFAQLDGSLIDVYMAATQMTDESGQTYPFTVNTLLDRALGPEGNYGAYTVNAHTDVANSPVADAVVSAAQARSVSVISAQQMLIWLDARNASSFGAIGFNASALSFTITKDPAARGLQAMLPTRSGNRLLGSVTRAGSPVSLRIATIKGVDYAFFAADAGAYVARYGIDSTGPAVTSTTPAAGAAGVGVASTVTITFGEVMTVSSIDTRSFELRDADNALVGATVSYDAATRTATLTPTVALRPSTTYAVTVRGGASGARVLDAAGNALASSVSWRFTTGSASTALPAACPCNSWVDSTTPVRASVADPNPVEVGVKFMSDVSGLITGIRFYKGEGNSGTHIGNLWSAGGTRLASATFTNETSTGWQQVNFASPVAIAANTVYVASYFAPNGHYAGDNFFFATTGVDNGPIHLLRDGLSGGNGVYRYGSTSGFPADTYRATNYWVDVVFSTDAAPPAPPAPPPTGSACTSPRNAIVAENCLTGNAPAEWDVSGIGDPGIQGYATQISVNRGSTVSFKVDTRAPAYRFDIYRMGYYGGRGARKIASVLPSASLPQSQPACLNDATTGLIDCGNWGVSGSWAVPASAVSGVYFAKVVRADTGGASHIVFIVRDDGGRSDLLFQTSDTTWQAYNAYGGNSLYTGSPAGRAYKVSYNRPFLTRAVDNGQDWVFNSEYPMVRWLEANGYDVSYFSSADTDLRASQLLNHRVFLSVGHDEYWSGAQRANVEAARHAGVNLAFFSGNEVFWKTRWENSIDGSDTPHRTLVSYKETHANARLDPSGIWTGTWRDERFSPPADGGRPENELTGTLFSVNEGATSAIQVSDSDGKLRLWRHTDLATLAAGSVATLADSTLGYEWDIDADNGFRPPGLIRLSSTTVANAPVLQDAGSTYASGPATHSLTLYRHASGARVFGAGTVQWAWGLDATHDRGGPAADPRMQQATVNLLADMHVQPGSLQADLVAASASGDALAPSSAISPPAGGVTAGATITLRGSASDSGGGVVGGVEVSVDGGATWHAASGRGNWSYNWTPATAGAVTIRSRAADDSGNLEAPGPGTSVSVGAPVCPCTIWSPAAAPILASASDTAAVNLGVTLRVTRNGFITGLRFYKGAGNTGTHVGTLWSRSGVALANATFTGESASGWQQVNFATPVAVTADTDYVASYHAPNGGYAADHGYFANAGAGTGPVQALADAASGGNGVYAYGPTSTFPSASYRSSNYWVDVVFRP
jgi:hypothetical protein